MFWRNISINSETKQDFERRKSRAFWERLMSKKKRKKKKFQKNRNYYFLTITSIKNGNRSPSQINQVHNLICTPFSFAGSFYMIHSYFKSCTKSFSSRLVFCLALSDLLSICDLIDVIEHASSQNCTIVGFLRIYESIPTCSGPLKFSLCYLSNLCLNLLELRDFFLIW